MARGRLQTWLGVFVLGVGALIAAIMGLFAWNIGTAETLHPNPAAVPSVSGPTTPTSWQATAAEAGNTARAQLADQNLPGLSVAVGVGGELVWAEGFGYSNLATRAAVTPDTQFRTGGVSVPLTAAAVGLLVERGRLNLDESVQRYVPEFPTKEWPVTVRQVMAHMGGIRQSRGDEEPLGERCDLTADGLRRFADHSLMFEPGTRFRYSSYGWILVSNVIENAAGERFFPFMQQEVLDPLGLTHTQVEFAADPTPDQTTYYYPRFAAEPRYGLQDVRAGDYSCFAGAGAYLSTPSDLVRFGLAVQRGALIRPETLAMLQADHTLSSGEPTGYGLGWDREMRTVGDQSTLTVGHDSEFLIGGTASLLIVPERGVVVAVMSNISFADTSAIALQIANVFSRPQT